MLRDGELRHEWDLGEMFAQLKFSEGFTHVPAEVRRDMWEEWRRNARKTRKQLGLSCGGVA